MPRRADLPALAVLCSGQGTNLQALLDAARAGRLRARVALVISDRPHAWALTRAQRAGVEAHFVDPQAHASRADFERTLITLCQAQGVRAVCLAGFMRILSPVFVRYYAGRILNIHPSLLPAFPGAHAIRDALAWGAKVTGVTVHVVDEELDHGPIIVQEAVAISPRETEASLLKKLHRVEHRLYPYAAQLLLAGKLKTAGRAVRVTGTRA